MTTLNEIHNALPKLDWRTDKDLLTVNFFMDGKKKNDDVVATLLENEDLNVTVSQLRGMILESKRAEKQAQQEQQEQADGETVYLNLPTAEANLFSDTDLTEMDDLIWKDLKFVPDETSIFYVKDTDDRNTYTAYLTSASSSDKADGKAIKEAFFRHTTDRPEQILKSLLQSIDGQRIDVAKELKKMPATAWNYLKIKAIQKDNNDPVPYSIVIPRGSTDKLYQGVIDFEADFRVNGKHNIEPPKQLTNDPNQIAIAYIDLGRLDAEYSGKTSELWDTFLLQRLHKPEYVSIFKAWSYAVAVGKNNSRQEMWLYGNGGTGKSCLCRSFIHGFNKLASKDICLAGSKDTGKSNFNSELLNKHLLVYADAKNLKNGMSEFKHNATGGDYIRVEGKGKDAASAFIYLKCLTCSNELPKVDMTDRSQSSRYIILPFTLDDKEMKQYGLMDSAGQVIGSADFQNQLDAEFECFLASCKPHYESRCVTDSNIDAHEALDELAAIEMDEVAVIAEFIAQYFEITSNSRDRLTQREFRAQCERGIDNIDETAGVKLYANVKFSDVRNYMEKKYGFKWKPAKINDVTVQAVVSTGYGIKIKSGDNNANADLALL